ncbi:hypothetical protein [Maritalea porphyrae]|uniref:Uncharacterized protein n=1 Tax=Maritalea porphyrae TaxID=880732 RepID=A0ABQ5UN34_9HYPH|nr:hypothetical protein [Maritalea porphyrae]GLQ15771.1 hypothetical protein GCM10007879_00200 [Maritalea porphyrae]
MAFALLAVSAILVIYAYRQPAGVAVVKVKREARRGQSVSISEHKNLS